MILHRTRTRPPSTEQFRYDEPERKRHSNRPPNRPGDKR